MASLPIRMLLSWALFALIVFAALGPARAIPRTGLGWQLDHFVGYFIFTSVICASFRRAFSVGGVVASIALTLEILQGFTPDRFPDVMGAFYSLSGVLTATLGADFIVRSQINRVEWPFMLAALPTRASKIMLRR